jgi:paraquat-inducible protein A
MTPPTGAVTAAGLSYLTCHSCRLVSKRPPNTGQRPLNCPRCGAHLHRRKPDSIARTWALLIAGYILYLPANLLPVTITTSIGYTQSDTIISGVIYFMTSGSWHIALIILIASVVVPVIKLLILTFLLISVQWRWRWRPGERTRLYRLTEAVGRWSMVDIYVVTIMVALVRLGALASVQVGPGAKYFAAVVVTTMLAAASFDPRLIWDAVEHPNERPHSR